MRNTNRWRVENQMKKRKNRVFDICQRRRYLSFSVLDFIELNLFEIFSKINWPEMMTLIWWKLTSETTISCNFRYLFFVILMSLDRNTFARVEKKNILKLIKSSVDRQTIVHFSPHLKSVNSTLSVVPHSTTRINQATVSNNFVAPKKSILFNDKLKIVYKNTWRALKCDEMVPRATK